MIADPRPPAIDLADDDDPIAAAIYLFARLVADGIVTVEQAAAIVDSASAADLADLLPMAPEKAIAAALAIGPEAADATLAAATGGQTVDAYQLLGAPQAIRIGISGQIADWHEAQTAANANALTIGAISLAAWQQRQTEINSRQIRAQAVTGADLAAARSEQEIRQEIATQAAYMTRFADRLAGDRLAGQEYSLLAIIARAATYAGAGNALFWRLWEQHRANRSPGWVAYYEARDDDSTCAPCSAAQGFYLVGRGPYPGRICLGRHRCRCRRYNVYNPERYAALLTGFVA